MSGGKYDTKRGLAAAQGGQPIEKIQNGDPRSGPNRDQRAQSVESGGPKASIQTGFTGTLAGQVPEHEGLVTVRGRFGVPPKTPTGVSGTPIAEGYNDRAGTGDLIKAGDDLQHGGS